jgi:hypothetical protein
VLDVVFRVRLADVGYRLNSRPECPFAGFPVRARERPRMARFRVARELRLVTAPANLASGILPPQSGSEQQEGERRAGDADERYQISRPLNWI